MNRSRFIQGLKGDIQLSEKERKRIIRKSLQKYSWKTKCTAAKCCGKKMPSLEGIAYIIQKEVKEKKSND